jgi:hypothetical protein
MRASSVMARSKYRAPSATEPTKWPNSSKLIVP